LLAICHVEDRILVTLDLDFADIRAYPSGSHRGIWVLRPAQQTFDVVTGLLLSGLRLADVEPAAGRLWIIDERRVRIRGAG
jgi:predicted nuclease of predicted toxin-antitoxin system